MGAGYTHECTKCGYSCPTSGPWEFYRDESGNIKEYGHPCPVSEEAEKRGIYGLKAEVCCLGCGRPFEAVLVEFKQPSKTGLSVWTGGCEPKDEYRRPDAVRCPDCGSTEWVLGPDEDNPPSCPRCKEGKLVGRRLWIS